MRSNRSLYNFVVGMASQILILVTSILIPRLVMVNIGSEANGLLNSVNQALVYLNLMEAGVGTVTVYALYSPVAENDRCRICSILAATQKYYRRTGTLYMVAVIVCSFAYPMLVDSELPKSTIIMVILFSGSASALGFFTHSKYNLLLQAEGKQYVLSLMNTTIHTLVSFLKVILLVNGFDVVAVQGMYFCSVVGQSIWMHLYVRKRYKWLDLNVKPDDEAISQKNSVLIHQISGLIFSNTDSLLLTMSWGLKYVSVYSVFTMVFSQLGNVVSILSSSIMHTLGQNYSSDEKTFDELYDKYELGSTVLTFFLSSVCAIMLPPFIKLYTAGVTDVDYLNPVYPPFFLAVFLLSNLRAPAQGAITVAGHFRRTTGRSIFESVINVTVSLILLPRFGIVGVLLGTIAALFYRTNDMIIYSAKWVHNQSLKKTYGRITRNLVIFLVFLVVGSTLSLDCGSLMSFVCYGVASGLAASMVFALVNGVFEKEMVNVIVKLFYDKKPKI